MDDKLLIQVYSIVPLGIHKTLPEYTFLFDYKGSMVVGLLSSCLINFWDKETGA